MSNNGNSDSLYAARLFVRKTQKRAFFSGLIFSFFLAILWSHSVGLGFLSGVIISIVNFQLMSVDAYSIIEKNPKKARKFIIGRYILRFVIMFGFLALIATRTNFNIYATFIGVFFVKIVLAVVQIIQGLNMAGKTSGG